MSWIITGTQKLDPGAAAYIDRVQVADTQPLEPALIAAINAFVVGCKADGIWDAIKASCILAGARTLEGALVPLAGAAPTNYNFVAGDYDRKTGLVGDGSTKYLDSNRNNNADPQDSQHLSCYATTVANAVAVSMITNVSSPGASHLGLAAVRSRNNQALGSFMAAGFNGISRASSASYVQRVASSSAILAQVSQTPSDDSIAILKSGTHRLAFYSIGDALDLAKLDARVTTLINAFAAAIP